VVVEASNALVAGAAVLGVHGDFDRAMHAVIDAVRSFLLGEFAGGYGVSAGQGEEGIAGVDVCGEYAENESGERQRSDSDGQNEKKRGGEAGSDIANETGW
jgi:hypothetical protein